MKCLPNRGHIGIFNRSYYEEVLAVRVHPKFLAKQKLPAQLSRPAFRSRAGSQKLKSRKGAALTTVIAERRRNKPTS
jgi:polyphosphate kinase 2 (PPK2 family)